MTFVDLAFYHNRTPNAQSLLGAHWPNLGYFEHLPQDWKKVLVKFADDQGHMQLPHFDYHYFRGRTSWLWPSLGAEKFVAGLQPDVVMVHGLIFPYQTLRLKQYLPSLTKLIIQHHAEIPGSNGMQRRRQRMVDKHVDAYLFAAKALAEPWIKEGIIDREKVFEVMEGSSVMDRIDKPQARRMLGLGEGPVFLWVGRFDRNKDPLTVVRAFEEYLQVQPDARLYMVYQDDTLLAEVQSAIVHKDAIVLKEKMDRKKLGYWYNASDYYISSSHSEGSGYALIEAMSCACIPVVTDIPSFRKITRNGEVGFLFERGSSAGLFEVLRKLDVQPDEAQREAVWQQFYDELSFKAIAEQLHRVCMTVCHKP